MTRRCRCRTRPNATVVTETYDCAIGLVIGIPPGIALGRWLWDLFAREHQCWFQRQLLRYGPLV